MTSFLTVSISTWSSLTPHAWAWEIISKRKSYFKGATSLGFCGILVLTILKLVVGNLTHEKHDL